MKKTRVSLSVIIPVYNEARTIKTILETVIAQKDVKEVIVVNDCSTDQTKRVLTTFSKKNPKVLVMHHQTNKGKGGAIQTGLRKVTGTHVLIQDADLEYDPTEIPNLLKPIRAGKAEVVYGSRFMGPHTNMYFWHAVGNKFLNFVVNILYNTTLSDMETCYKVLPIQLMREIRLRENDFRIEPEITCKILKRGVRIYETPISYVGRSFEEGKKIGWFDAVLAMQTILLIRLGLHRLWRG